MVGMLQLMQWLLILPLRVLTSILGSFQVFVVIGSHLEHQLVVDDHRGPAAPPVDGLVIPVRESPGFTFILLLLLTRLPWFIPLDC